MQLECYCKVANDIMKNMIYDYIIASMKYNHINTNNNNNAVHCNNHIIMII